MNKITNLLCLSLLLLGATVLGMNPSFASSLASGGQVNLEERLIKATKSGEIEEVERLIKQGVSVEAKDKLDRTPLNLTANNHRIGYSRRINMCKLLIKNKASVEAKDFYGQTPLMHAADEAHEDMCKLLIAHGASVEAQDRDGRTALYVAADRKASWDDEVVCKLLIDVQLESARKYRATKTAVAIFLGIVRKRGKNLPGIMPYDVAKMIAYQVLAMVQQSKRPVTELINEIENPERRAKWLAYANEQMKSVNK